MRFQGVRRIRRALRRPRTLDVTLVVLLELFGSILIVIAVRVDATTIGAIFSHMVCSAFLLWRRGHPYAVAAAVLGAEVAFAALTGNPTQDGIPMLIALYSLGRHAPGPGLRLWTATAIAALAYGGASALLQANRTEGIASAVGTFVLVGIGQLFRLQYELRERRTQERAERAVQAERRRIARELHDVVAHHISVINVLVGAGRTTMATDPERAQEVLVTAERTAREAMTEMRQLLHVLRAEDGDEPENHANVGTATLPALVEQASRSGVPARLDVAGDPVPLPAAIDHAVYRIVQESLTNTRKHAPGARASVRLAYLGEAVEVEVVDDGSGGPGRTGDDAPGYGLGGMAERVALCGGQLQTGRRPEGGFRVHARIPLPAETGTSLPEIVPGTADSGAKGGVSA